MFMQEFGSGQNKIRVRALNVPTAVVSAVSKKRAGELTPQERDGLPPDIEPADDYYKARLHPIFKHTVLQDRGPLITS